MEDSELRDRLRIAGYLSECDRQDDGHASGNGPYPMRGDMTSEEYIMRLMQTIGSLDSMVRSLRDELALLREKDAEHGIERKRLMALIEAKDKDISSLSKQMARLLGKVDSLTKALEDKSHQLANRNRDKFGTKTNRTKSRKNMPGRDDDHDDYSASSDTETEQETGASESAVEGKPLETPKSDIQNPMDLSEFELKFGKGRPDSYEQAHADRVVLFDCDRSQVRGTVIGETVCSVFTKVSYNEERQYVFVTSQWEEPVYDGETGQVIDHVMRQETKHYPLEGDRILAGAAREAIVRMDMLPGMIGGRFMTAEMIADVIFQYLICHTPINRQAKAMKETGLTINRQTVTDIYHAVGYMLQPVYEALKKKVMAHNAFLNCDETWFRLHFKDATKKGYIWIMANREQDLMFYFYDDGSRARKVLQEMIGDSTVKAIMSDGYIAYKHLDADDSGIEHIADLAHIRTKFMDWIEVAPDDDAVEMIRDFNELFYMERRYRMRKLTYEDIAAARISPETMEVLQRIADRLTRVEKRMEESGEGIPKVGERAVRYMKNLWASVLRWCRDGRYSLDNNLAERCARPVALMRKNIMHFASHKGAEVYTILGSLVETCRMRKQSVMRYLVKVIQEVNDGNKDYESLIPGVLTL
ncbi:MAG: IS66 family transposase [Bacteroides sp.]|nr:IS66 family transposase [Bacteroides sp.]